MLVKVHMWAFENGKVRIVNLPDSEVEVGSDLKPEYQVNILLDLVFHYGQNDFQSRPISSISAGDVIELDNEYYLVKAIGFKKMLAEEFEQYKNLEQDARILQSLLS